MDDQTKRALAALDAIGSALVGMPMKDCMCVLFRLLVTGAKECDLTKDEFLGMAGFMFDEVKLYPKTIDQTRIR